MLDGCELNPNKIQQNSIIQEYKCVECGSICIHRNIHHHARMQDMQQICRAAMRSSTLTELRLKILQTPTPYKLYQELSV